MLNFQKVCQRFLKSSLNKIKNAGYVILLLFVFFSPNRKLNRRKYPLKKLYWKKKF